MGWFLTEQQADILIEKVSEKADIYAPMLFAGEGRFSETDVIRYGVISKSADIVFERISSHSQETAESCASWGNAPRDLQHVCNAARFCFPG